MATDGQVKGLPRRVLDGPEGQSIRRLEDYAMALERRLAALELRLAADEVGGVAGASAAALETTGADVVVHTAAPPTAGQVLTATGATAADWETPAPPAGSAGGDLSGTYPNPSVAAVHETSGPTKLTLAGIADGEFLKRSGATITSAAVTAAVTSVFGRSGAVTAQSGDYTVAQVTGAVPNTRLVSAGVGLAGGGDLSADRTLSLDVSAALPLLVPPRVLSANYSLPANQDLVIGGGLSVGTHGWKSAGGAGLRVRTSTRRRSWEPTSRPQFPSPYDEYFDSGATTWGSKWAKFDPGTLLTATQDPTRNCGVLSNAATAGSDRITGMFQRLGHGSFDVYGLFFIVHEVQTTAGVEIGVAVLDDTANGASAKCQTCSLNMSSTGISVRALTTAWSNSTTRVATATAVSQAVACRLRVTNATFSADVSIDGRSWGRVLSEGTSLGFAPQYVGIVMNSEAGAANSPAVAGCWAFQVVPTNGVASKNTTFMGGLS